MNLVNERRLRAHLRAIEESSFGTRYTLSQDWGNEVNKSRHMIPGEEFLVGSGSYGMVFACADKNRREQLFAIKVILKVTTEMLLPSVPVLENNSEDAIKQEVKMLENVSILFAKRRGAVEIVDEFESPNATFIVMTLLKGKTLAQYCSEYNKRCWGTELHQRERTAGFPAAKKFARDIAFMVHLLHTVKLIHRDLSPTNVMYNVESGKLYFAIVDFALCARMLEIEPHKFGVVDVPGKGTVRAPEVLVAIRDDGKTVYDDKADCWSFGYLLYMMISNGKALDLEQLDQTLSCLDPDDRKISPFDLVKSLTDPDPALRWSMKQALGHGWLTCGKMQVEYREMEGMRALLLAAEQILEQEAIADVKEEMLKNAVADQSESESDDTESVFEVSESEEGDDETARNRENQQQFPRGRTNSLGSMSPLRGSAKADRTRDWERRRKNEGLPLQTTLSSTFFTVHQRAREKEARRRDRGSGSELDMGLATPALISTVTVSNPSSGAQTPSSAHSLSRVNSREGLLMPPNNKSSQKKGRGSVRDRSAAERFLHDELADRDDEDRHSVVSNHSTASSSRSSVSYVPSRATTPGLSVGGLVRTYSCESVRSFASRGSSLAPTPRHHRLHDEERERMYERRDVAESELVLARRRIIDMQKTLDGKLKEIDAHMSRLQEEIVDDLIKRRNHRFSVLPEEFRKHIYTNVLMGKPADLTARRLEELSKDIRGLRAQLEYKWSSDNINGGKRKDNSNAVRSLLSKMQEFRSCMERLTNSRRDIEKGLRDFGALFSAVSNRITKFIKGPRAKEASQSVIDQLESFTVECLAIESHLNELRLFET